MTCLGLAAASGTRHIDFGVIHQDKTRQDKTRQDKTRQDKTRQLHHSSQPRCLHMQPISRAILLSPYQCAKAAAWKLVPAWHCVCQAILATVASCGSWRKQSPEGPSSRNLPDLLGRRPSERRSRETCTLRAESAATNKRAADRVGSSEKVSGVHENRGSMLPGNCRTLAQTCVRPCRLPNRLQATRSPTAHRKRVNRTASAAAAGDTLLQQGGSASHVQS